MLPVGTSDLSLLADEAMALMAKSARDPAFFAQKARRAMAMARARVLFRGCALGARVSADGKVIEYDDRAVVEGHQPLDDAPNRVRLSGPRHGQDREVLSHEAVDV